MKAKVSSLYLNGRRLPANKVAQTVIGDLNLSVSKHPITLRCDHEAVVLSDDATMLLPALHNVVCVCIAAHGLALLGVEIVGAKELAQEWRCVPMSPTNQAQRPLADGGLGGKETMKQPESNEAAERASGSLERPVQHPRPYTEFEMRVATETIYTAKTVRDVLGLLRDEGKAERLILACSHCGLDLRKGMEDVAALVKMLNEKLSHAADDRAMASGND